MMEDLQKEPRQRFLALDTSTAVMAVAMMEDHALLEERNERAERNHSVHVVPVMEHRWPPATHSLGNLTALPLALAQARTRASALR